MQYVCNIGNVVSTITYEVVKLPVLAVKQEDKSIYGKYHVDVVLQFTSILEASMDDLW